MERKKMNPWLNAKKTFNDRNTEVLTIGRICILFGVLGMLIAMASVGVIGYIGSQSKFIPLVIKKDEFGNTINKTELDHIQEAKDADYRVAAADFIQSIRLVTSDKELQKKAVLKVYGFLKSNDPATNKANEYLNGTDEMNPFNRADKELVSVEEISSMRLSDASFQVDWIEKIRSKDGQLKEKAKMRAILQMYQGSPGLSTTEADELRNEHFIFIKDFNWAKNNI